MSETQLSTNRRDIRAVVESYREQFKMALPKLLTPERFVRVALTCINKNPKLLQCTQESLLACLLDCASLGIEPDGRRAHLIPYGDKCTLIIDYKGIAELVRRSGEVSDLHSDIVCEGDDFDYMFGTGSFLKHKIDIRKERGAVIGAYSYVKLKDGAESFDVMGVAEIEKVRKRSRAGTSGPWVTDTAEMQKKTVFRRHSKWLPLSPELRDKIEVDDEPMTEQERFAAAKPVSDIKFDNPPEEPPPEEKKAEKEKQSKSAKKPMLGPAGHAEGEAGVMNEGKAVAPPKATPVQGLRNLMATSKVEEGPLLAHLFANMVVQQGDTLESLPVELIGQIITDWPTIVEGMKA